VFSVLPSNFQENLDKNSCTPDEYVSQTAFHKAVDVFHKEPAKNSDLIISADTIVVLNQEILEKPANPTHAKEMLQKLSGNTHTVLTAVVLLLPKHIPQGNILIWSWI
jgi:septum formation protein